MHDIGFASGLVLLYFLYKTIVWIIQKDYSEQFKKENNAQET
tara:strand:+ start:527 stop:652 length:126 start_codon:yes stop_codon:yes gene_type:complete